MDVETSGGTDPKMVRRVRWARVAIVASIVLLVGWSIGWFMTWVWPLAASGIGNDPLWRQHWPDRGWAWGRLPIYARLAVPWGWLFVSAVGVVDAVVALLVGRRHELPDRWTIALGLTGLALLLVPLAAVAFGADLLLPPPVVEQPGG
jgi:hypothetical protein